MLILCDNIPKKFFAFAFAFVQSVSTLQFIFIFYFSKSTRSVLTAATHACDVLPEAAGVQTLLPGVELVNPALQAQQLSQPRTAHYTACNINHPKPVLTGQVDCTAQITNGVTLTTTMSTLIAKAAPTASNSVADPGFPRGEAPIPEGGR